MADRAADQDFLRGSRKAEQEIRHGVEGAGQRGHRNGVDEGLRPGQLRGVSPGRGWNEPLNGRYIAVDPVRANSSQGNPVMSKPHVRALQRPLHFVPICSRGFLLWIID